LSFFNLFKHPRFDEGATGDHDGVHFGFQEMTLIVNMRIAVPVANEIDFSSGGLCTWVCFADGIG